MKSLSRYDEREDPVVLRKDFVKEHAGVGYYGAKMKTPQDLFTNVLKSVSTPQAPVPGSISHKVLAVGKPIRPQSSLSKQGKKSSARPGSQYTKQIKGHYEWESSNTLRNSVLPQSIPKAERFVLEKKGSYFVEYKDPGESLTVQTGAFSTTMASTAIGMTRIGRSIIQDQQVQNLTSHSTKKVISSSPTQRGDGIIHRKTTESFHFRRDSEKIKLDEFLAKGRPLWTMETNKCSPGPDVYEHKTQFDLIQEQAKLKPNKCLFGESHEKYKRAADIDRTIKVFDHSKHYGACTVGYNRLASDPISPMDTRQARKKNNPVITIPNSKAILFQHEIQRAKETPSPSRYNQNDRAIKYTRHQDVSIGLDLRPLDRKPGLSPGPGHYETEQLTSLMRKIEDKNSIKSFFSDTASMTTKSTYSFKGWTTASKASPHSSQHYSNVKSRYAASNLLESSNRATHHSKKPSVFDYDAKIEEREEEDQADKGYNEDSPQLEKYAATMQYQVEARIKENGPRLSENGGNANNDYQEYVESLEGVNIRQGKNSVLQSQNALSSNQMETATDNDPHQGFNVHQRRSKLRNHKNIYGSSGQYNSVKRLTAQSLKSIGKSTLSSVGFTHNQFI